MTRDPTARGRPSRAVVPMRALTAGLLALFLALGLAAGCGEFGGRGSGTWSDHKGDVPFIVGDVAQGKRVSASTGKPPLYFFTATW